MSDTLPVWKKIYQVVSGSNSNITKDIVSDCLKLCKNDLIEGLLQYKPYTKASFESWKKSANNVFGSDDEMLKFIKTLSVELDLDTSNTWTIVCNYFMFEYYGKIGELSSIIKYETAARKLVENIWYFYSGERTFLLKTLKHIFVCVCDETSIFYKEYDAVIKSMDFKKLWKNLLKMFYNLITEIDKEKAPFVQDVERWIHRNNREQVEVALLLTLATKYIDLDGEELVELLDKFMHHGFTRHPYYFEHTSLSRPTDLADVKKAEIGCIITIANRYWQNPEKFKLNPKIGEQMEILKKVDGHAVVLYTCAVLKASIFPTEENLNYCNDTIIPLFEKSIFIDIYQCGTSKANHKTEVGKLVVEGIYTLMAQFCKICEDPRYAFEQSGFISVISFLLKINDIRARTTFSEIIRIAVDAFPYDFYNFVEICHNLLPSKTSFREVFHLLQNFGTYCSDIPWMYGKRTEFCIEDTEKIFRDSSCELFMMPKGTKGSKYKIYGAYSTKYEFKYDFYTLLEQYLNIVVNTGNIQPMIFSRLITGYSLIVQIIKYYPDDYRKDIKLRECVSKLENIPKPFFENVTNNSSDLLKLYYFLHFTIVNEGKMTFSETFPEVKRKFILPLCLPDIEDTPIQDVFSNQILTDTALTRTLRDEEPGKDHSFCLMYIKFVQNLVQQDEIENCIPGVWYVLSKVFPHHLRWTYADDLQMKQITKTCLSIFVGFLQKNYSQLSSKAKHLYNNLIFALSCDEWISKMFLGTFYSNPFLLQTVMEQETDWTNGKRLVVLESLKYQVILLFIVFKNNQNVPLKPTTVLQENVGIIVKAISSYMLNPYNTKLATLACKFLELLARDDHFPMLALLGLDYDQVQRLFLDRLRDPMEDDGLKNEIINLICTCIFHQHGMTAAFFNVKCSRKWYYDKTNEKMPHDDTLSDFMIDYLQNIRKTSEYLKNPLQVGILNVMCSLWMCRKQHLIEDVTNLDQFWRLLSDPMFITYDKKSTVYKCIFKIFSIQLYSRPKIKEKEIKTVSKTEKASLNVPEEKVDKSTTHFQAVVADFVKNKTLMKKWLEYILSLFIRLPEDESELEEIVLLLKAWAEFLTIAMEKLPNIFENDETKMMIVDMSLNSMKLDMGNTTVLMSWCDLIFLVVSNWGDIYKNNSEPLIEKCIHMYKVIKIYYTLLPTKARENLLCLIDVIINTLKDYFENNSNKLLELLEEITEPVEYEHQLLKNEVINKLKQESHKAKECALPWTLIVTLSNSILKLKNAKDCSRWFHYQNYFKILITTAPDLLLNKDSRNLAKFIIYSITCFIQSPLGIDVVTYDFRKFYDALEAPIRHLVIGDPYKINPIHLKEGWIICTLLIKFNHALVLKFGYEALQKCYYFFALYDILIQHIISLPEHSVDLTALNLVTSMLIFIDALLLNWNMEWYKRSNDTYFLLLTGVKRIINSGISVILRPKNITFYPIDENEKIIQIADGISTEFMVIVINKMIEIIGLASGCLYRINPSLREMLDSQLPEITLYMLIENDFSVPKFENPITHDLTYGRILCVAHFLCKTLSQLESIKKKNINKGSSTIDWQKFSSYVGLVENQNQLDDLTNQKLSAFLRYSMYEFSGLADPWISQLDIDIVRDCFEVLMMFLGTQVLIAVRNNDTTMLPLYTRNLCSELQFFHDYLKKKTGEILKSQVTTPIRLSDSFSTSEKDLYNRYFTHYFVTNRYEEILDDHFLLVMSIWFTNICQLQ